MSLDPEKTTVSRMEYPSILNSLTSLRFLAAVWVLVFHFSEFFPGTALQESSAARLGFLGVDFFFVLSGFVLSLVYLPKVAASRFDYWSFLVRRVARIYPLHVLTLIVTLALSIVGLRLGWEYSVWDLGLWRERESGEIIRALFTHLTLIHAWGSTKGLLFNLPSWSISAEWFAYLTFPIFLVAFARLLSRPVVLVMLCCAALILLDQANQIATGRSLLSVTWNIGALRIIPSFALGIALYQLGTRHTLGRKGSIFAFSGAVIALIGAVTFEAANVVVALCLAAIVFLAADAERNGHLKALCSAFPVLLGEVSYGVYLWHFPLGVVIFDVVLTHRGEVGTPLAMALIAGAIALVTLVSWLSYKLFEGPSRKAVIAGAMALTSSPSLVKTAPTKSE